MDSPPQCSTTMRHFLPSSSVIIVQAAQTCLALSLAHLTIATPVLVEKYLQAKTAPCVPAPASPKNCERCARMARTSVLAFTLGGMFCEVSAL